MSERCTGYDLDLTRRELLWRFGTGLGGIALSSLICSESAASAGKTLSHLRLGRNA